MDLEQYTCRYFVSYSGIKLPLKLVNELEQASDLDNRNTYFRGYYDADQRLLLCENMVYGEIELRHRYSYHPNNALSEAEITDADGEITVLRFDEQGQPLSEDE